MLTEVLADRRRGASEIEERLLAALAEALGRETGAGAAERLLLRLTRELHTHQPSMANLLQLLDRSWSLWEENGGKPNREGEGRCRQRLLRFWEERRNRRAGVLGELCGHLVSLWERRVATADGPAWTLLTLSRSGTVLAGLTALHASGARFRLVVGEGRPGGEGLSLAAELRRRGVEAWAATDAVVMALAAGSAPPPPFPAAPEAMAVVVGADAVGPESFVNKVGTLPLAAAARQTRRPCWVLAETSKLLPLELFRLLELPAAPPDELGAPAEVPVCAFDFERVSLNLATHVVSEEGAAEPAAVRRWAQHMPVSRRLPEVWGAAASGAAR